MPTKFHLTLFRTVFFALFFAGIFFSNSVLAQTVGDYRSRANGNWNANTTWERWNGTSWIAVNPYAAPGVSATVTVNHDITANNLSLNFNTLNINSQKTLTIIGNLTLGYSGSSRTFTFNGEGTLNCQGNFIIGQTSVPGGFFQYFTHHIIAISNLSQFNVSGNITIQSGRESSVLALSFDRRLHSELNINSGNFSVNGQITLNNDDSVLITRLILGNNNPTLFLNYSHSSNMPIVNNNTGTHTVTLSTSGSKVFYNALGVQNIRNTTYANLGISGSGNKNFAGNTTVTNSIILFGGTLMNTSTNLTLNTNGTIVRTEGLLNNLLGGTTTFHVEYPSHTSSITTGNEIPNSANRLNNLQYTRY